jgi:ribonucrease Y
MEYMIVAIVAVVAILIGIFLGKAIFAKNTQKQVDDADQQAKKLVEDAKIHADTLKEKKILEAKEHFLQLKSEHEKEVIQRTQKISENENRLKQQQQSVNDKNASLQKQIQEYDQLKENLDRQLEIVNV